MIFVYILFTIFAIALAQCFLVFSVKKPAKITHVLQLSSTSSTPKIISMTVIIVYIFILIFFIKDLHSPKPDVYLQSFSQYLMSNTKDTTGTSQNTYRQLEHIEFPYQEHYFFLYVSSDISQKTVEKTSKYLQSVLCKKPCIIYMYDNLHAYILDRAKAAISTDAAMRQWTEQNYVFVAEHFLGYLPSNPNASFVYEPLKDTMYYSHFK